MKLLKYILGILALLIVLFLLLGLIKPTLTYECKTSVNKPLAEAWAVSQDEEKLPEWLDGFQKVEHISGSPGAVGAISDIYFITDGQEMTIRETITSVIPNKSVAMVFASDFMNMNYKIMMNAVGGKTIIHSTSTCEGNGLISKSLVALMKSYIITQEETNLANLKKVIEKNSTNYFLL